MAGSLRPSGLRSVDTRRPTSGSVARAGSVPSRVRSDRRSLQVRWKLFCHSCKTRDDIYLESPSGFTFTLGVYESSDITEGVR